MLNALYTVTVYMQDWDSVSRTATWRRAVIHGVSWHGKSGISLSQSKGAGVDQKASYSVRIPRNSLPSGIRPAPGDVVCLGEVGDGDVIRLADIPKRYSTQNNGGSIPRFTVTAVGDYLSARCLPHLRLEGE